MNFSTGCLSFLTAWYLGFKNEWSKRGRQKYMAFLWLSLEVTYHCFSCTLLVEADTETLGAGKMCIDYLLIGEWQVSRRACEMGVLCHNHLWKMQSVHRIVCYVAKGNGTLQKRKRLKNLTSNHRKKSTFKEAAVSLTTDFSTAMMEIRNHWKTFKVSKENIWQPQSLF